MYDLFLQLACGRNVCKLKGSGSVLQKCVLMKLTTICKKQKLIAMKINRFMMFCDVCENGLLAVLFRL